MTQYSLVRNESDIKPRMRVAGEKIALFRRFFESRAGEQSAK